MAGPLWIDSDDALESLLARLPALPLSLDTEADSFHHYRDKVCLVQLSCGEAAALVDPLSGLDPAPIGRVLADPGRPKRMHGADYDVRILHRDFGFEIAGLFDTMIAARLLGERALGLASLLEAHLGVRLDKGSQRADWSKRPLTPRMAEYAIEDVRHLDALAALLEERLAGAGRLGWVHEECERLTAVRWRDRRAEDPEPFRRVKGAPGLPPRGLALLREVWQWRDGVARAGDRPPFRVLHDEVVLAIATAAPETQRALEGLPGIPETVARRHAAGLLAAVRRGLDCPEEDLPRRREAARPESDPAVDAAADRLRAGRDRIAKDLGLEPAVIASRALLEDLAKRIVAGEDPWAVPELRAWQSGLLRQAVA